MDASAERDFMSFTTFGTVKVSNLRPHITSDDVKEIFEKIAPVMQAFIKYDHDGEHTGTAVVQYAKKADARSAWKSMDNLEVDGVPMRVTLGTVKPALRELGNELGRKRMARPMTRRARSQSPFPRRRRLSDFGRSRSRSRPRFRRRGRGGKFRRGRGRGRGRGRKNGYKVKKMFDDSEVESRRNRFKREDGDHWGGKKIPKDGMKNVLDSELDKWNEMDVE